MYGGSDFEGTVSASIASAQRTRLQPIRASVSNARCYVLYMVCVHAGTLLASVLMQYTAPKPSCVRGGRSMPANLFVGAQQAVKWIQRLASFLTFAVLLRAHAPAQLDRCYATHARANTSYTPVRARTHTHTHMTIHTAQTHITMHTTPLQRMHRRTHDTQTRLLVTQDNTQTRLYVTVGNSEAYS